MSAPARASLAGLLTLLGCSAPAERAELAERSEPTAQRETTPAHEGPLSFNRDIAPIVFENCAPCHRPGEAGPFPLLTYRDVSRRASQIVEVTTSRFMPPWLPEPGYGEFDGERRLSDEQVARIARWQSEGALEGDPADLPALPQWTAGWQLGEPDLVVTLDETYTVPADGFDVFRNFVIPVPLEGLRWVRAVEIRPGNPQIVHHAEMRIDRTRSSRTLAEADAEPGFGDMNMGDARAPDGLTITWTPGRVPHPGLDGIAWRLAPGTDLVLQLHMLPSGKPETIRPSIGLHFADEPPEHELFSLVLHSRKIDIPPGEGDYVVDDSYELPVDLELFSVYPHAHYLGRDIHAWATLPDGSRRWLVRIDDWDFNWQDLYFYAEPVVVPAGSVIHMHFVYDNSADNPRNPNQPPQRVQSGSKSTDEMGTLTFVTLPRGVETLDALRESLARQDLRKDPTDWLTHQNLGSLLVAQGKLDEAATHLERVLELNPARTHAMSALGLVYARKGDIMRAIELYRRAIEINPFYVEAHTSLGIALAELGDEREAWTHLKKAVQLEPNGSEPLFNAGTFLAERGRLDEAIRLFEKALAADPDSALVHNNLGTALVRQQRLDEAKSHYRRALELDPSYAEAHANFANTLVMEDRFDEAIEHYRRALELGADPADVEYNLDIAIRRKGASSP